MTLHTYTPNQCPYQVSTSYTFLQTFSGRPPILTPLVKTIPRQALRDVGKNGKKPAANQY